MVCVSSSASSSSVGVELVNEIQHLQIFPRQIDQIWGHMTLVWGHMTGHITLVLGHMTGHITLVWGHMTGQIDHIWGHITLVWGHMTDHIWGHMTGHMTRHMTIDSERWCRHIWLWLKKRNAAGCSANTRSSAHLLSDAHCWKKLHREVGVVS